MMRRGRPLMRAAVVGGVAHHAGKKSAEKKYAEQEQNQQIADLQAAQAAQAAPAPPPVDAPVAAPAAPVDVAGQLTQLKALLDAGALTQAEFDTQKQKLLNG